MPWEYRHMHTVPWRKISQPSHTFYTLQHIKKIFLAIVKYVKIKKTTKLQASRIFQRQRRSSCSEKLSGQFINQISIFWKLWSTKKNATRRGINLSPVWLLPALIDRKNSIFIIRIKIPLGKPSPLQVSECCGELKDHHLTARSTCPVSCQLHWSPIQESILKCCFRQGWMGALAEEQQWPWVWDVPCTQMHRCIKILKCKCY